MKRSKIRNDNVVTTTKRLSKSEDRRSSGRCHGESEQITALYTMIDENRIFPFEYIILGLGAKVRIEKVDLTDDERIVFVCRRRRERS